MINSEEFSKRLQQIMEHYSLSASAFAEQIGVQRSSVSHILSGRNKPSLDFVIKVVDTFQEVNLYWLLNGKGTFPSTTSNNNPNPTNATANPSNKENISKVIIFYKNGTFEVFEN
jgi:transcriptional regulator with XRE-family HTH domain